MHNKTFHDWRFNLAIGKEPVLPRESHSRLHFDQSLKIRIRYCFIFRPIFNLFRHVSRFEVEEDKHEHTIYGGEVFSARAEV
jgi:hypothetical protein